VFSVVVSPLVSVFRSRSRPPCGGGAGGGGGGGSCDLPPPGSLLTCQMKPPGPKETPPVGLTQGYAARL
jgi:hypothetical protein